MRSPWDLGACVVVGYGERVGEKRKAERDVEGCEGRGVCFALVFLLLFFACSFFPERISTPFGISWVTWNPNHVCSRYNLVIRIQIY